MLAHGDSNSFINLLQCGQVTPQTALNSTGALPLHCACHYSCLPVLTYLLDTCNVPLEQFDQTGSTPLHYAAKANDLNLVKHLINDRGHKCNLKNAAGKTPYDLATDAYVRQVILPKQLQEQTVQETAAGTLPFGIDRQQRFNVPPPPMNVGGSPGNIMQPTGSLGYGGGGGGGGGPPQHMQPPPPTNIPSPYTSLSTHTAQPSYAPPPTDPNRRIIKSDGFHSSASDPILQQRYGHKNVNAYSGPPPPTNLPVPMSAPLPVNVNGARGKYVVVDYNTGGEQVYGHQGQQVGEHVQQQQNNGYASGGYMAPPTATMNMTPAPAQVMAPTATLNMMSAPTPIMVPTATLNTTPAPATIPTVSAPAPFQSSNEVKPFQPMESHSRTSSSSSSYVSGSTTGLPPPPFSTFDPTEGQDTKVVGKNTSALM
ncbi:hypothetical protein TL16_g11924 [Triparma laevis f. inornata]|uniref:Uncharacterized protein n=2 Tax=Triparma laevis TaxID=1534972 RepID=A0A9W6Z8X0_9STRA|nr:hypothetical protein TrLO_g3982 [Triparma laevis f. longispina]GMH90980.1 hypothetical protein TL16_g11924 [Triparma laevis f. inornata]